MNYVTILRLGAKLIVGVTLSMIRYFTNKKDICLSKLCLISANDYYFSCSQFPFLAPHFHRDRQGKRVLVAQKNSPKQNELVCRSSRKLFIFVLKNPIAFWKNSQTCQKKRNKRVKQRLILPVFFHFQNIFLSFYPLSMACFLPHQIASCLEYAQPAKRGH